MQLKEPTPITDIFVSGLAHVEKASAGNVRFVLYAIRQSGDRDETERVIACRLIMPLEALPDAIAKSINATAESCGSDATKFPLLRFH